MCGYFDTLVADLQQVYDVAIPNDRLVLQIKGTVAELELSNMKTRLRAGIEAKAARGELKVLLPPGYVGSVPSFVEKEKWRNLRVAKHIAEEGERRATPCPRLPRVTPRLCSSISTFSSG
jgi:DNA invertase Pin-like site-specific DNA recombinase